MNQKVVNFINLHPDVASLAGFDFAIECNDYSMIESILDDTARRYSTGPQKQQILKELAQLGNAMTRSAHSLVQLYEKPPIELIIKFHLSGVEERHGMRIQFLTGRVQMPIMDCKVTFTHGPVILVMDKEKQLWETTVPKDAPSGNMEEKPVDYRVYQSQTVVPLSRAVKNQP